MAESDFEVLRVVGEIQVSPKCLLVAKLLRVRGTPCFELRRYARSRAGLRPLRGGLVLGVEKCAAAHALTTALLRAILAEAGDASEGAGRVPGKGETEEGQDGEQRHEPSEA